MTAAGRLPTHRGCHWGGTTTPYRVSFPATAVSPEPRPASRPPVPGSSPWPRPCFRRAWKLPGNQEKRAHQPLDRPRPFRD